MKKSEKKKLDKLWADYIKERAEYRCEYCKRLDINHGGTVTLNSAHIIGRRNHTLRWNPLNGVCLCYIHHMAYDEHQPQHQDIFDSCIGKKRWEVLIKLSQEIKTEYNYEEIKKGIYD